MVRSEQKQTAARALLKPDFRYTDEQWRDIERELPKGGDREYYEEFRRTIERYAQGYRIIGPSPQETRERLKRACRNVANSAEGLIFSTQEMYFLAQRGVLLEDFDCDDTGDVFFEFMKALPRIKSLADKLYDRVNARGRGKYHFRDQLIFILLLQWANCGGEIRASGAQNGARDGGPLIRYLLAATKPLNLQPALTVESARSVVRKSRERVLGAIAWRESVRSHVV